MKSVKQAPHSEQAPGHGMHCRDILFTPRCSPRAREFPRSLNFFVRRTVAELRGVKLDQFSDFGLFSNTPRTYWRGPTLEGTRGSRMVVFSHPSKQLCRRYMRSTECPSSLSCHLVVVIFASTSHVTGWEGRPPK